MTNDILKYIHGHAIVRAPSDEGAGGEGTTDTTDADTGDEGGTTDSQTETEQVLGQEADDTTTDGDKTEDDKPVLGAEDGDGEDKDDDEGDDKDDVVPEDGVYELTLPEGVELSEEDTAMWSETFKEAGLTTKQANALVAKQAELVMQDQKAYADTMAKQQADHLKTAKADPDIGGDNWAASVKLANLGLKTLGGTAVRDLLLKTGHGNNPEVIRELKRIGELVKDDKFEQGSTHETPSTPESSWYGDTTPETKKG